MFVFNNTTVTNYTGESTNYNEINNLDLILLQCYEIYFIIGAVTSISTLLFGSVSWILIKKWRRFKNYVFLCVIVNYTILYPLFFYQFAVSSDSYVYWMGKVIHFVVDSFSCWLFLSTIMIYRDIVKVFTHQFTRKFLKYNAVGWGLPLIDFILSVTGDCTKIDVLKAIAQNDFLLVLLLLVNFIMYARVLCSLIMSVDIRSSPRRGYKFQVSTFTFMMSGIFLLPAIVVSSSDALVFGLIPGMLFITQTMVINLCFLLLKPNRLLWKEYCNKVPTLARLPTLPTEV